MFLANKLTITSLKAFSCCSQIICNLNISGIIKELREKYLYWMKLVETTLLSSVSSNKMQLQKWWIELILKHNILCRQKRIDEQKDDTKGINSSLSTEEFLPKLFITFLVMVLCISLVSLYLSCTKQYTFFNRRYWVTFVNENVEVFENKNYSLQPKLQIIEMREMGQYMF